jgi:ribosomal protein S1
MTNVMDNLLGTSQDGGIASFRLGQNIKCTVIDYNSSRILLEIDENGLTGIIPKQEMGTFSDEDSKIDVGAAIEAVVIDLEDDEGLMILSLKKASQDSVWAELGEMEKEDRSFKVKIEEANRGGLMAKYKNLRAFLPVSQLMPLNYPRVGNSDTAGILTKLQEHIGKEFVVKIMTLSREEGKIIISEKLAEEENSKKALAGLNVNDVVEGTVSGVVKFGIFVTFGGLEGLVHVSELDWGHVSRPGDHYKLGDKVEIMIISIDGDKLSLSIKQLKEDPWLNLIENYSEGSEVSGRVVRWNNNGVFIEITNEIQGLFTLANLGAESIDDVKVKEGENWTGIIKYINTKSHRIELSK